MFTCSILYLRLIHETWASRFFVCTATAKKRKHKTFCYTWSDETFQPSESGQNHDRRLDLGHSQDCIRMYGITNQWFFEFNWACIFALHTTISLSHSCASAHQPIRHRQDRKPDIHFHHSVFISRKASAIRCLLDDSSQARRTRYCHGIKRKGSANPCADRAVHAMR